MDSSKSVNLRKSASSETAYLDHQQLIIVLYIKAMTPNNHKTPIENISGYPVFTRVRGGRYT